MPRRSPLRTGAFRLTPAGTLQACAVRELRKGDVYFLPAGLERGPWLLAISAPYRAHGGGWQVRSRDAAAFMKEVTLSDAAAPLWVAAAPDEPELEPVDAATPADALMAREEDALQLDRGEVFTELMAFLFGEGPHPAHVLRRVFQLAGEIEPRLLRAIDPAAVRSLLRRDAGGHLVRVGLILAGTRCDARSPRLHDELVRAVLSVAAARCPGGVPAGAGGSSLTLLELRADEDLAAYGQREAAVRSLLGFMFYEGSEPGVVVRRVYSLAQWRQAASPLLLGMTLHQLGQIFGEVRATWSWRVKHVVNRFLELRQVRGVKSRFQKSDEACANYATAQLGNQNRKGGAARVA